MRPSALLVALLFAAPLCAVEILPVSTDQKELCVLLASSVWTKDGVGQPVFTKKQLAEAPHWKPEEGTPLPLGADAALKIALESYRKGKPDNWVLFGSVTASLTPLQYFGPDGILRVGPDCYFLRFGVAPSKDGKTPVPGFFEKETAYVLLNGQMPSVLITEKIDGLPLPESIPDPEQVRRWANPEFARLQSRLDRNHRLANPYLDVQTVASGRSGPDHWLTLDDLLPYLEGTPDERSLALLILESKGFGSKGNHFLYVHKNSKQVTVDNQVFPNLATASKWIAEKDITLIYTLRPNDISLPGVAKRNMLMPKTGYLDESE